MILLICLSAVTKLGTPTTNNHIKFWEIPIKYWFFKISKQLLLICSAEQYRPLKVEALLSFWWGLWPASSNSTPSLWMFTKDTEPMLSVKSNPDLMKDFFCLWVKIKIVSLWMINSTFYPFLNTSITSNLSIKRVSSIKKLLKNLVLSRRIWKGSRLLVKLSALLKQSTRLKL